MSELGNLKVRSSQTIILWASPQELKHIVLWRFMSIGNSLNPVVYLVSLIKWQTAGNSPLHKENTYIISQ